MITIKQKIKGGLKRINTLWKDLVNDRQPDVNKILSIFSGYMSFLEENEEILQPDPGSLKQLFEVKEQLHHYTDISSKRDRMSLLNDAYIGLILQLSESIEELEHKLEESTFIPNEHAFYN